MFKRILIANRGEIAVRIIRTCQEMGIETVAVYSEVDRQAAHVRIADRAVCIGPPLAAKSYLNITSIIAAAQITGADAIHPGYGFLAENPYFADACESAGITFIGPSSHAMAIMGSKAQARKEMAAIGVPIVPGSEGLVRNEREALNIADKIGYPVLLKASGGGGGRGMRLVQSPSELNRVFSSAQREAQNSFGDSQVYLEKYLEEPRHIEFQILGDKEGNIIHLGERDCSLQQRNKKILEETPSTALTPELREEMSKVAVKAAKAVNYYNAGTIEFLLDKYKNYYFIEMNTRIQVEHPITEMVAGIDMVREQIRIAAGEPLSLTQEDVLLRGHAMECRINAEDPERDFMPTPGVVSHFELPGGPGVRVDTAIHDGYVIPSDYDSLILKLVVWAPERSWAIARMKRALQELKIEGVANTVSFHQRIMENAFFRRGEVYTNFIQRRMF